MGSFSWIHWLLVILAALLLFGGRGKISELMGDFASGIKAFKKGMAEDDTPKNEPVKSIDQKTATAAPKAEEHHAEGVRS